ncbi:hypothetical protein JHK85_011807 [Glycine max]|nr:hypothetical protein JHK85_011807 [Glycine max]
MGHTNKHSPGCLFPHNIQDKNTYLAVIYFCVRHQSWYIQFDNLSCWIQNYI